MRRDIRAIGRNQSVRRFKDPSLPFLERSDTEIAPMNPNKRLDLHIRSRTRLIQQQFVQKAQHSLQSPTACLPKIGDISERAYLQPQKTGIDMLQEHLHLMLLKNLKKCKENKNVKNLQEQIGKKRQKIEEKEEINKKQTEKNRLQQLRLKLNQLYGQLKLEENKLKIQYKIEEKIEKRFNGFFDKMARRVQKTTTVDASQNTQQPVIVAKQIKEPPLPKKGKAISRFRVAAFAVYFSLFFPKYAKYFAIIRKDNFVKKIIQGKAIENSIQQCHNLLELIKIKKIWKQLSTQSKDTSSSKSSVMSSENQLLQGSFFEDLKLQNANSLLAFILSHILSAIRAGKINELIRNIDLLLTNRSFIADHLFLESQLFGITSNQQMMMNLNTCQQKILLVNFLLIKLTAFSFMMNNSYMSDNQANYIFNKQNNNIYQNLSFVTSKHLLVCGIYLVHLCNTLNQRSKTTQKLLQGNLECLKLQELPVPMAQLQFKPKMKIATGSSLSTNKRISIQDSIQAFNSGKQGIFIKNTKFIADLFGNFKENKAKEQQFLSIISDIRDQIHNKLVLFKRQRYQSYSQQALKCFKQKQNNLQVNNNIKQQRTEQQRLLIKSYCNDFKARRNNKIIQGSTKVSQPEKLSKQESQINENSQKSKDQIQNSKKSYES